MPGSRADPRVTSIEGLNARDLDAGHLGAGQPGFLVCDVSFISLKLALPPALGLAAPGAGAVLLVKPQFEAGRAAIGKGGLLRDAGDGVRIAEEMSAWLDAIAGLAHARLLPFADRRRRRQSRIPACRGQGPVSSRLTISRLGAQGDGVADTERGPVFVPFALPGEEVVAAVERDRGVLISVANPSPLRVEPPCRHFGTCGGCAIQHLEPGAYRAWKRDIVVGALASRGIETPVGELVACQPQTRRRAVFSARRTDAGMLLGYNRVLSGEIVAIEECPILLPEIVAALDGIRQLATLIASTPRAFRIAGNIDRVRPRPCRERVRHAVGESAPPRNAFRHHARLRPAHGRRRDRGRAEAADRHVRRHCRCGAARRLPAGDRGRRKCHGRPGRRASRARQEDRRPVLGMRHFRIAAGQRAEVHAFEGDAAALAAFDRAFRHAAGLKRVTGERRDLFRRPLSFKELASFDGLVFDPPRAGAEEQAKQIARSEIPFVAAVSCNPATLARDLRILIDGGYSLKSRDADRPVPVVAACRSGGLA